jgi:hypothetical protein
MDLTNYNSKTSTYVPTAVHAACPHARRRRAVIVHHATTAHKMSKVDGPAIGIDLGTTYSCVGVWQHDRYVKSFVRDIGEG